MATDTQKIKLNRDRKPCESLESGLVENVEEYLENRERCKHLIDRGYK